ncbi:rhoptry kinase family protein ROP23 (incomplete catalytic triad) [Toxoplasma gondii VAND]|uniref:Rhoptry kinase family protein ROP23 (Incomplete catalytic triad) n=1 Tax=Toxoplasma gondii VAND TaxID=933077 RepID=A0A086PV42_TOXGO|nr:rhoptry kinase family protein ROP23 (incomplete catalytic triad) [Toxoplasma gondii VAND]
MEKILWAASVFIAAQLDSSFTVHVYAKESTVLSELVESGTRLRPEEEGSFLTSPRSDEETLVQGAGPRGPEEKAQAAIDEAEVEPFATNSNTGTFSSFPPELHAFSPFGVIVREPKDMFFTVFSRLGGRVKERDFVGELIQRLARAVFPLFRRLHFWGESPGTQHAQQSGGGVEWGHKAVVRVLRIMRDRPVPPVYEDSRRRVMLKTGVGVLREHSPLVMNSLSGNRKVTITVKDYIPVAGWGLCVGVVHPESNQEFLLLNFVSLADAAWGKWFEWRLRKIAETLQWLGLRNPSEAYSQDRLMLPLDLLEISNSSRYFVRAPFVVPNLFVLMPRPATSLSDLVSFMSTTKNIGQTLAVRLSLTLQTIRVVAGFNNRGFIDADIRPASFFVNAKGLVFLGIFTRTTIAKRGRRASGRRQFDVATAPELVFREKVFFRRDEKTNAWALGITLYYIWCNRFPFGILDGDSAPPPELFQPVPPEFGVCVHNMPDPVKVLVAELLDRQRRARPTANTAMQREIFRHLQDLLSASKLSALPRTVPVVALLKGIK